jgi:hypothetical protein
MTARDWLHKCNRLNRSNSPSEARGDKGTGSRIKSPAWACVCPAHASSGDVRPRIAGTASSALKERLEERRGELSSTTLRRPMERGMKNLRHLNPNPIYLSSWAVAYLKFPCNHSGEYFAQKV